MPLPSRTDTPGAKTTLGFAGRAWRLALKHPLLALVAVAGVAAAAITVSYSTPSTLTTGVTPPPVQFLAGDDTGSTNDYVTAFSISTNRTYLTATVKGVPEASLVIGSFFKLQNVDDASHAVTISTPQVSNGMVSTYTIEFLDATPSVVGTLTLTAATPSASFTLPAATTYSARLTLTLATGAGADNVAESSALTLSVA